MLSTDGDSDRCFATFLFFFYIKVINNSTLPYPCLSFAFPFSRRPLVQPATFGSDDDRWFGSSKKEINEDKRR